MRKIWKYAVVLGICMLFFGLNVTMADADTLTYGDFTYTVSEEEATITGYTGSDTSVVIPSSIEGYTVTAIGTRAFYDVSTIQEVTLPDTLTSLGYYCFAGTSITNVTIPKSVTSCSYQQSTFGVQYYGPFAAANELKEVTFEEGTTYIPAHILANCTALEKVNIPDTVTRIGSAAFQSCANLTSIELPSGLEIIGSWAFKTAGLKSIEIPEKVSSIQSSAFCECTALETVKFTGTKDSGVTVEIGSEAFANCTALSEVTLSENVRAIEDKGFYNCEPLTEIEFPASLTSLGYFSFGGTSITNVTIPKSVTSCSAQKSTFGVEYYGPFAGANKLKKVTFEEGITSIPAYTLANCTSLEEVDIPDTVISIGNCAFQTTTNLKNVELPSELVCINGDAFRTSGIEHVVFPEKIEIIGGYSFNECTNLKTVEFTAASDSEIAVYINSYAFDGCTALSKVRFSDNITTIETGAFVSCTSLENIILPKNLSRLNYNVFNGTAVKEMIVPKSLVSCGYNSALNYIGPLNLELAKVVFEPGMTKIPDFILATSSESTSLEQVLIPESVTSIGTGAFRNRTGFTIYGIEGSYAETYAKENNIPFAYWDGVLYTQTTAAGELEDVDTTNFKVTIAGTEYEVRDDFNMVTAQNIFVEKEDKRVICVLLNDEVYQMHSIDEVLRPTVTVNVSNQKLVYQNGAFIPDTFDVTVRVGCIIADGMPYALSDFENLGWGVTVDSMTLDVGDGKFKIGSDFLGFSSINKNIEETIGLGTYKEYVFDVTAYSYYEPDTINTSHPIHVELSTGQAASKVIQITNLDLQAEKAEEEKQKREAEQAATQAKTEINQLSNMIALDTMFQYYCNSTQIKNIKSYLYTWLGEIAASTSISYTKSDETIRGYVAGKLGVSTKSSLFGSHTSGKTYVVVPNSKYGSKTFEFKVEMDGFVFGEGDPFAVIGELSYRVVNTEGIPDGIPKDGTGQMAFTNIKDLSSKIESVAENAVQDAYDETWGSHANEVADIIVDQTIMKIVDKKCGSFSNGVFTLLTNTISSMTKGVTIACPVDVYVYDMSGVLCGAIENNEITVDEDRIGLQVEDDVKYLYLSGDDYKIKLVGTDEGTMTYSVTEYGDGMEELRKVVFTDISLSLGKTYEGFVMEPLFLDSDFYALTSDTGEKILPDGDSYEEPMPPVENEDAGNESGTGDGSTESESGAGDGNMENGTGTDNGTTGNEQDTASQSVPAKNSIHTIKNLRYKVTNAKKRTVMVFGAKKKTLTAVTIPAVIKINGYQFKVTAINKNAFKNNKKLKKVTIGKNVSSIGKGAFYKCTRLKTVKVNTAKLTKKKVGKNAFKGIYKTCTFKVPKKKKVLYKKIFLSRGAKKTCKVG